MNIKIKINVHDGNKTEKLFSYMGLKSGYIVQFKWWKKMIFIRETFEVQYTCIGSEGNIKQIHASEKKQKVSSDSRIVGTRILIIYDN
jgi:hypothetical protein